ncbi:helix-turn-helix domain-containing protein [Streptomyces sp. NPDC058200]|uniref:helix-turn-helix domain-containing protein n=1 Tax=Streptomyces sp. NPDC058200 TaxID=3346378 RepID=UPI0036E07435
MFQPMSRFVHGSCCGPARFGGVRTSPNSSGWQRCWWIAARACYAEQGLAGLEEKSRGGPRTQGQPQARARGTALMRMSPPADSGLSRWSTWTLADFLKCRESISVSWHYIARVWRKDNLKPHGS